MSMVDYNNRSQVTDCKTDNKRIGWLLVRILVVAVLITAACLKSYQLSTFSSLGDGLFDQRWFQVLLIECELILALVLFFGLFSRIAWFITTILFVAFGIVSLFKCISGAESCGCFGSVNVNPFLTTIMDAVIVAL
ncbi:MAG: hypothetical protein LBC74_08300, partial [Planctomycetaceae bacterium]|nr:hypothetical protein [Planctomycetaceae bacterium]